ncbi:MAG: MltA domain-containing protein [Proteobacteria bacterium]|nr:MltA domain-containing protein [Pseudomonadota bacterium]MBU1582392.1 MltA domain-containing protein [Pseudomonadota bacterium]MBU2452176.1 MltA domain-containing protein [Pseudomonadota bacterium]MBU2627179.1 MltA domain-containing protein [Pseudomonadota bacterium]
MALVAAACFFFGCHPGSKETPSQLNSLKQLTPRHYPLFIDTLDFKGLTASIDHSLSYFKKVPLQRKYQYGKQIYTAAHMIRSLETFKAFLEKEPSTAALNEFIQTFFIVYAAAGNQDGEVLFTGYFEPTYEGSLTRNDDAVYPLYGRPDDLVEIDLSAFSDQFKGQKRLVARVDDSTKRVVPYFSRGQINTLEDFHTRSEPVVWLKSRVDRFFLEIQGSGRIDLGNGDLLRVHYAGSNGNAYRSVGRYLIEKNEILKENMSMQAIRTWLEFHPQRMDEVLHHNESFVFFKTEAGGPYGSLGVEVTAFRSIATDSRIFPKGALCFMQSQLPDTIRINPIKEWEKASFFVMNQDTGGAIRGPSRADLFCGNNNYAGFTAGHMNQYGKLFFLVLKPDPE